MAALALSACGGGGASGITASAGVEQSARLTVSVGSGGVVTSEPAGIDCGPQCAQDLAPGTTIRLLAQPAAGYRLKSWSDVCLVDAATQACSVTVARAATVAATFEPIPVNPLLTVFGDPGGTLTSLDGRLNCGSQCKIAATDAKPITLIAEPAAGYLFAGWSVPTCAATSRTCEVTLKSDTEVRATFAPVRLTLSNAGGGVVSSSPAGIDCGLTCSGVFGPGSTVRLSAAADAGQTFTRWAGAAQACGTALVCDVVLGSQVGAADRAVTAVFSPLSRFALSVSSNTGGSVTTGVAGAACGAACAASLTQGTVAVLAATPETGYLFQGWTSTPAGLCPGTGLCSITIGANTAVQAQFAPLPPKIYDLSVQTGTGGGVTALAAGVDCGTVCSRSLTEGTVLTLVATAASNYRFDSWGGACQGSTPSCTVTMSAGQVVTASFSPVLHTLSVTAGTGGSVTSQPTGISCGASCSTTLMQGTAVTLSATPDAGYRFDGWSGGACTGTATCVFSLAQASNVSASFSRILWPVQVTTSGGGTVTSTPAGINCGSNCAASFPQGNSVTLVAVPDAGKSLRGWTGACASSSGTTCAFTVSSSQAITATFADVTAPSVVSVSPERSVTNVAVAVPVVMNFSETINCASVSAAFELSGGGAVVPGTTRCSGSTATFTPTATLVASRTYTARLAAGVQDAVGNATSADTSWTFTTASGDTATAFTFLAYGDSRAGGLIPCGGNVIHASLVARMAAEAASMAFHLGDMTTVPDRTTNWVQNGSTCPSNGSLKDLVAPFTSKTPAAGLPLFLFPVIGNHDENTALNWYPDRYGNGYCDVFPAPANLVPNHTTATYFQDKSASFRLTNTAFYADLCRNSGSSTYPKYLYYSFDHKNSHFVVLHLNNSEGEDLMACSAANCSDTSNYTAYPNKHQLDWLRADLAAARANPAITHVFVFLHAPLFTDSSSDTPHVSRNLLAQEFSAANKVKMVFSGHIHSYERSYPIRGDATQNVRDDTAGVVYLISGGGGSDLTGYSVPRSTLMANRGSLNHYLRIRVNGSQITATAVDAAGVVFDSVQR